jgi:hypothetical protein
MEVSEVDELKTYLKRAWRKYYNYMAGMCMFSTPDREKIKKDFCDGIQLPVERFDEWGLDTF